MPLRDAGDGLKPNCRSAPANDPLKYSIFPDFVAEYCEKTAYNKGYAEYYLRHNNDFITIMNGEERVSGAAVLLEEACFTGRRVREYSAALL